MNMNVHLTNGDVVVAFAIALLGSLLLANRLRNLTVFRLILSAVVANVIGIAAILGVEMLPALLT
ncbi:MAG: hypothetical protein ACRYG5_01360 [Janthinobacterium lividum]